MNISWHFYDLNCLGFCQLYSWQYGGKSKFISLSKCMSVKISILWSSPWKMQKKMIHRLSLSVNYWWSYYTSKKILNFEFVGELLSASCCVIEVLIHHWVYPLPLWFTAPIHCILYTMLWRAHLRSSSAYITWFAS